MAKVRFDEQVAAHYDETSADMFRPEVLDPAVDFLEELAGDGAALELGVGTGRVALLLSGRGVPELRRVPPGERVRAFDVRRNHLAFDEYTDFAGQILFSHHYWINDGEVQTFSAPFRYVWPAELDLMARLAGMTLRERWAGWTREPFTNESTSHVSVWEKAG